MFRYIDFDVQPGAEYKYRLVLAIEDPNDPDQRNKRAPTASTLERTVIDRINKKGTPDPDSSLKNIFYLWSEPSAESDPVVVADGRQLIAGPVKAIDARTRYVKPGQEPSAEVMLLEFDDEKATSIPGKVTAYRGFVANVKMDVEVPEYTEGVLRKKEDHPVLGEYRHPGSGRRSRSWHWRLEVTGRTAGLPQWSFSPSSMKWNRPGCFNGMTGQRMMVAPDLARVAMEPKADTEGKVDTAKEAEKVMAVALDVVGDDDDAAETRQAEWKAIDDVAEVGNDRRFGRLPANRKRPANSVKRRQPAANGCGFFCADWADRND